MCKGWLGFSLARPGAGTMKTAPIAARLGALDAATALQLDSGFTESIDTLQEEIGHMLRAMSAEKQAAGKQRSSREDLALRARARAALDSQPLLPHVTCIKQSLAHSDRDCMRWHVGPLCMLA